MCGIAGILHNDKQSVSATLLASMIGRVRHRGPDAAAVLVDGPVGLAHARLSLIDLDNGQQPMQTDDGKLVITFNGEVFNYIELRRTLMQRGHRFRTRSDTEVILHAYAEYGTRCVEHFNGQWAFAIWDRRRRRLFLSRDRMGIRPLFHTRVGDRFLFASEIKSLLACPEVPRRLDPFGMNQLFTFWTTQAPATVFQHISQLPPGHNLVVQDGRTSVTAYWQLDYTPVAQPRSLNDYSAELRELLDDATRLRLRADVPVGAYVSGGLDSTIAAASAQRVVGDRLETFSVTFDDAEFDERVYQQAVVRRLGVKHHALRCSYADIAAAFPQVVWHAEAPVLRTASTPLYLLSARVHATGCKAVLTGEGADELFGGYDIFKEAKVRRFYARNPNSVPRAALFGQLYPYLPRLHAQSVAMRRAFFRVKPEDLASPFFSHLPRWSMTAQLKHLFSPDFLPRDQYNEPFEQLRKALPTEFSVWPPFCQSQYLETMILMPGYILAAQGDRAAMAHSVEGRFPFLDHRLAEFAARLPPRLKMNGLKEKFLLKRAFDSVLPDEVRQRTKQPFRAPDARAFLNTDRATRRAPYIDKLLSSRRIQQDGIFEPRAVDHLLKKLRTKQTVGTRDNMALVGVLSTQILVDQFLDKTPAPPTANRDRPALTITSPVDSMYHAGTT